MRALTQVGAHALYLLVFFHRTIKAPSPLPLNEASSTSGGPVPARPRLQHEFHPHQNASKTGDWAEKADTSLHRQTCGLSPLSLLAIIGGVLPIRRQQRHRPHHRRAGSASSDEATGAGRKAQVQLVVALDGNVRRQT